jgi:hypothetical protein
VLVASIASFASIRVFTVAEPCVTRKGSMVRCGTAFGGLSAHLVGRRLHRLMIERAIIQAMVGGSDKGGFPAPAFSSAF